MTAEPLLSLREITRDLRTSRTQIRRMVDEGMPVACYTPHGWPKFLRSQVDEYMAERARIAARRGGAA